MFVAEGVVMEQRGGEFLQDLSDNFPIGGTEIGAKGLTTGKEQLVRDDVRKGTHDVWVEFYLAEGRFNVIGVHDDIDSRVVRPEGIDTRENFLLHRPKATGFLGTVWG
jgi:hypothetical protein